MPMTRAEYSQLRKCMARTASESDAEALASVRRANMILATHSLTWQAVFERLVRVVDSVEVIEEIPAQLAPAGRGGAEGGSSLTRRAPPRTNDTEDWDRLFDDAMAGASGTFLDTLEDIHEQWEGERWLSDKQKEVVRNATERYAERHPGGRVR